MYPLGGRSLPGFLLTFPGGSFPREVDDHGRDIGYDVTNLADNGAR